jgi:putative colanic acid biosynthesis acetyltransferase WcaF
VRVKFPWRLSIGAHSWIGESVWIDNLDEVKIGSNACVSQGVYFCTGSHDWSSPRFDLVTRPIEIGDEAWICAKACVGPGVRVGRGAILTLGSVATQDLESWTCYTSTATRRVSVRRRTCVAARSETAR